MSTFAAILRKDLQLELRSGESTLTLGLLSMLILTVLTFALNAPAGDSALAAGALWAAILLGGTTGATRVMVVEWQNGCLEALLLSPADRSAIYCAKLVASFIFMAVAEVTATLLLVLFFNLDFSFRLVRLAPIIAMGGLGFAALATLLAMLQVQTRLGDLLLPLLTIPVFVPALIAGVSATNAALAGLPFAAFAHWLKILAASDILFLAGGYLLFEQIVGDG